MRKIIVAAMLALMVSCAKDEAGSKELALTVAKTSFSWTSEVTTASVAVTAKGRWTATTDVNWCKPWKRSGEGDTKLGLWVSPNLTSAERTGTLTLKGSGITQQVKLSQPAFAGDVDSYDYRLPLVFHVMYDDASNDTLNVRKGHLSKIVDEVNKLYASNNMHLKFEMAANDEDGNELEEPGVVRHQVDFSDYDPYWFLAADNKETAEYAGWEQNLKQFINVYVFRFRQRDGDEAVMGISCQPIVPTSHPLDSILATDVANDFSYVSTPWGCCINNAYIYEWQERNVVNSAYIASTLAHELGHYLGLLHTFSSDACNEDDACTDTHISDYYAYLEQVTQRVAESVASGQPLYIDDVAQREDCLTGDTFVADNIMDYAYCLNEKLTTQQQARVRHLLKYGPLVPGPKLTDFPVASRTRNGTGQPRLEPVKQRCPAVRPSRLSILRE